MFFDAMSIKENIFFKISGLQIVILGNYNEELLIIMENVFVYLAFLAKKKERKS